MKKILHFLLLTCLAIPFNSWAAKPFISNNQGVISPQKAYARLFGEAPFRLEGKTTDTLQKQREMLTMP